MTLYLGIDVSKAKLDCSLLLDVDENKHKAKVVANTPEGLHELLIWLDKQGVCPLQVHAVLEGTGVYHEQSALALHKAKVTVSIVNPARTKDFAKSVGEHSKTDLTDSRILARYGALLRPLVWQPPPEPVRQLQALLARRQALATDLQRERNRQEKAQATDTPERIHQSLHHSIHFLLQHLAELDKDIDQHIDRHPELKDDSALLQSIPAVGPKVGHQLLCVMHTHAFESAEQLAAYLGLVPVERQSGSSVKGPARLSKAGPARIRAVLYMAAVVAIRYNPHVKALYERLLLKNKSKMAALGAAMRKLVHLCFGVLKTRVPYRHDYARMA